nr:peroxin [Yarrowia lipolytica]
MASCGPSNALQNLSKHASADRSLQHDRMAPGGAPGAQRQQFRSQTQGGQLNNEFQQFAQAGPAHNSFEQSQMGPHFGQQHFGQPHQPQMGQHAPMAHGQQSDWAQSFSQLNLGPQTGPQHTQQSNWGEDFMGESPQSHQGQPQMANGVMGSMSGMSSFGPMYSNSQLMNSTYGLQTEHQQTHKTETKSSQDAPFEAAFGAVEESITKTSDKGKEVEKDPMEQTYRYDQADALNRQAEHISDNISREEVDIKTDENGEFASIARQIASSLEEADKSKFEKSTFMNLMRRIGNHEVTLDGDKLVNKEGEDIREEVRDELLREGASQENGFQSEAQQTAPLPVHHEAPPPEQIHPHTETGDKQLEDPMVYIEQEAARRAAESGRTVEEEKLNFYSPFEYAQKLGPQGVAKQSNWEEDYDF